MVSMMRVWSLASLSGLNIGIALNCGVGHRGSSNLSLLCLWCRQAATPIQPLAWELPNRCGQKKKKLPPCINTYVYIYLLKRKPHFGRKYRTHISYEGLIYLLKNYYNSDISKLTRPCFWPLYGKRTRLSLTCKK